MTTPTTTSLLRSRFPVRRGITAALLAMMVAAHSVDAQQTRAGMFAEAATQAITTSDASFTRRAALTRLYSAPDVRPIWTAGGSPTRQAAAAIRVLADIATRGLDPRDYDTATLAAMARSLDARSDSVQIARFDVALSRSMIQLLGDLHEGRANPRSLGFNLPLSHRDLDLAAMTVATSRAPDPATVVASAEPVYVGYRRLEALLGRYRLLAADTSLAVPPATRVTLRAGDSYAGAATLRRLLVALGDLAPAAAARDAGQSTQYTATLSAAIAVFQRRHGLDADGVAGPTTMRALRVPLTQRVRQIELTLERWRWLPDSAPARYAVVNIPGFRLYVFEDDPAAAQPELRMNVIVGRAGSRATPIFTGNVEQVVFRPYWDVPPSIARGEIIPATRRNWSYFARQNLEIVRGGDVGATTYPLTSANLSRVAAGTLRIRQRPGPANSLGLVKFVFPNAYNVYLHDTPTRSLFSETQRDFSHGCIRVQEPLALAEVVLRGQDGWNRISIDSAMHGTRTLRITVARPLAVYILYQTAVVAADGTARFYNDLYGHDATLARTLARDRPHQQ